MTNLSEYIVSLLPKTVTPKFVGDLPSLSAEGVAVAVYHSGVNTNYFGTTTALYRPVVRISIRHKDYPTGCAFAQSIHETLHDYTEVKKPRATWRDLLGTTWEDLLDTTWGYLYNNTYTDGTLLSVTAVGTPNYLGRSAEKLHEFQSLYQILLKE